ncbi:MAG: ribosomal protein, partial [Nocardia sp.]|nr:ribosomal protein [Nocardia sp.]
GFDPETNEWLEGSDKVREEWEGRYAEAERRHKMHTAQMEKMAADAAAEAANGGSSNYSSETGAQVATATSSSSSSSSAEPAGGSLASDAQLAALREKLSGNA